jgi:CPA2 family monovalent cation:H+ antiporter-2
VPVIVRTRTTDLDRLRAAGATEVVPEAIEGSLMLASHALALVGVPMRRVIRITRTQRDARYNLLRGYFHGADDDTVNEREHERLGTVTRRWAPNPSGGRGLSCAARHLPWSACGAPAAGVGRAGRRRWCSGKPEVLAVAEQKLLRG